MTTNYREILRLESLGLNKTDIASATQCARNTVSTTLARAKACGLRWPLPEGMMVFVLRVFPIPKRGKTPGKLSDRKSTRLNSSHSRASRMPSSA